ncbi:MAG: SDR family NAD(P)-dependent oxidoreductase, partial [Longimicrobiales bacterium]
ACRSAAAEALAIGAVDILVNNAGFAIFDEVESARSEDLESMMMTNYFGALHMSRALLPSMIPRGSGAIVNVASIAGIMGFFRMGGYCASKFALVGLSEALRDEVHASGVRVSLVCPGTVETEFFLLAEKGKMPLASRLVLAISPQRVARAIVRAVERGSYRIVVPWTAAIFMKFKELFPRTAHFLMRNVSAAIERNPN